MPETKMTPEQYAQHLIELRSLRGPLLAREVLDLIEDNIARWNQGSWRTEDNGAETAIEAFVDDPLNPTCTTSFCFAGWVGALHRVKWQVDRMTPAGASPEWIGDPEVCDCTGPLCVDSSHATLVGRYATRVLEMDPVDADALFGGENSLSALQAGVEALEIGGDVYSAVHYEMDDSVWSEDDEDDDDD